jgi:hypothetical protein
VWIGTGMELPTNRPDLDFMVPAPLMVTTLALCGLAVGAGILLLFGGTSGKSGDFLFTQGRHPMGRADMCDDSLLGDQSRSPVSDGICAGWPSPTAIRGRLAQVSHACSRCCRPVSGTLRGTSLHAIAARASAPSSRVVSIQNRHLDDDRQRCGCYGVYGYLSY